MLRGVLAVLGVLGFIAGIFAYKNWQQKNNIAQALNESKTTQSTTSSCLQTPLHVILPHQVFSRQQITEIIVRPQNRFTRPCTFSIHLQAPDFIITPLQDMVEITLEPQRSGQAVWRLQARQPGRSKIAVSAGQQLTVRGVLVTEWPMSSIQARILSWVGIILGPLFTLPAFYSLWQWLKTRQQIDPYKYES